MHTQEKGEAEKDSGYIVNWYKEAIELFQKIDDQQKSDQSESLDRIQYLDDLLRRDSIVPKEMGKEVNVV